MITLKGRTPARTVQADPTLRRIDPAARADPKATSLERSALVAEIVRAGAIRRGELPPDPKPIDARAEFILASGRKARGEEE